MNLLQFLVARMYFWWQEMHFWPQEMYFWPFLVAHDLDNKSETHVFPSSIQTPPGSIGPGAQCNAYCLIYWGIDCLCAHLFKYVAYARIMLMCFNGWDQGLLASPKQIY